jgi:hypothetical protein
MRRHLAGVTREFEKGWEATTMSEPVRPRPGKAAPLAQLIHEAG